MNRAITRNKTVLLGWTVIGALMLAGCSSKPGEAEIAKGLADAFECPMLEVRDVKKIDGMARNDGGYEVSYSYNVNLVGGGDKAIELLPEWFTLLEAEPTARRQRDQLQPSDPQRKMAEDNLKEIQTRFANITPCQTTTGYFTLQQLAVSMQHKIDTAAPQIKAPVGLNVKGSGIMVKAESGWHFVEPERAAMITDSTIVESAKSYTAPVQMATWRSFNHEGKMFTAQVPAHGQCTKEPTKESGQNEELCSFSTRRTDMHVWVLTPTTSPAAAETIDVWLNEEVARIAERNGETVVTTQPLEGMKGRDIVVVSSQGERSIRIILTGNHLIEAIATPKHGKPDDKVERARFIKGVVPVVPVSHPAALVEPVSTGS